MELSVSGARLAATSTWFAACSQECDLSEILTDDARWWAPPGPGDLPACQRARLLREAVSRHTTTGLRFEVTRTLEDGDRLVVQASCHGLLTGGEPYRNEYLTTFTFTGIRIGGIREWSDNHGERIHLPLRAASPTTAPRGADNEEETWASE